MRKYLHRAIRNSRIVKWFMKAPMPSWFVLCADVMLVLLSAYITYYFNPDTTPDETSIIFEPHFKCLVYTALVLIAMLICKSYQSIVRLSAFEDTYRIFGSIVSAAIFAYICDWIGEEWMQLHYFGTWNIMALSFISFALLVSLRIVIKYVYTIASSTSENKQRVAIFGSAINSYALATALKSENDGEFDPVFLLSYTDKKNEKMAGSIPIRPFNKENLRETFDKFNCDTLIFLSTQLEIIRKGYGDVFLRNGIKLLMLNQVEEFKVTGEDSEPVLSPHVQNIRIEDLLGRMPIVTGNTHIRERMKGKTVMITGAAGSIGSEIVRQVAEFGAARIILVDQAETPMHEMQLEMEKSFPNTEVCLCIADVANRSRMQNIFDRYNPQIVYHAAAYKHVPMMENNPEEAAHTNILGTKNIVDLALEHNVHKFVMISTDKAVNPTNIMGASKRVAEIYVQSLANHLRKNNAEPSTRFVTTRFGNVLGSNGSVIPLFRRQIEAGGPVTVTHRDIIRYFMTIPEACSLVLEAGCMGEGGEIFIFDMGEPVKIYDLAQRMISLAGLRPDIDIKIVETGLRPGEKLYEELLNNREHTLATHHKKIMIAKVRQYDYDEVCRHLQHLAEAVANNDVHEVVAEIKRIVPEYKSQNSKWDKVDTELSEQDLIHEITSDN